MDYFEKWICKIERVSSYTKIDKIFVWCNAQLHESTSTIRQEWINFAIFRIQNVFLTSTVFGNVFVGNFVFLSDLVNDLFEILILDHRFWMDSLIKYQMAKEKIKFNCYFQVLGVGTSHMTLQRISWRSVQNC